MKESKNKIANDPETVANRLHSAAIHLLRRVRKQDSAMGIGPARLSALSVLVFGGAMSLKQLAAAEQVKPPTMSRIVDALERAALIEIVADEKDRRGILIRPTAKGAKLLHAGRRRRVKALADQLRLLKGPDIETLLEATSILERVDRGWKERT
jgi:DNA-binding MarR family transcriptional regulator